MSNKTISQIYIIINKCENLPDLRTNTEISKTIIPKWRVIFRGVKENLATQLVEGFNEAFWMCEIFLTIKSPRNFQIVVVDNKDREAGFISLDLTEGMPFADGVRIKPGPDPDGYRETLRKSQPPQISILQNTNSKATLKYWLWITQFSNETKVKTNTITGGLKTNLKKLKTFSRSAISLNFDKSDNYDTAKNPFEDFEESTETIDYNQHKNKSTTSNPFDVDDSTSIFQNNYGNSSFAEVEAEKFRPSVWLPQLKRSSSLPMIEEIDISTKNPFLNFTDDSPKASYTKKLKEFKERISLTMPSTIVENRDIDDFFKLGDLYRAVSKKPNSEERITINQDFFTLLNDIQRRYTGLMNQVTQLEAEHEQMIMEMNHNSEELLRIKQKLIVNGMIDLLAGVDES